MLLWLSLLVGLGVILGTVGLVWAMRRAERRARRGLYRALGLAESTVEFLMQRNRDVIVELTYLRRQGEGGLVEGAGAGAVRGRKVILRKPEPPRSRPASDIPIEGDRPIRPDRGGAMPDGQTRH
jgi:hypothetical protein